MNLDGQQANRVLVISLLIIILSGVPCYSWHKTLTFVQHLSYETSKIYSIIHLIAKQIQVIKILSFRPR
jgi:hypothetical protein